MYVVVHTLSKITSCLFLDQEHAHIIVLIKNGKGSNISDIRIFCV